MKATRSEPAVGGCPCPFGAQQLKILGRVRFQSARHGKCVGPFPLQRNAASREGKCSAVRLLHSDLDIQSGPADEQEKGQRRESPNMRDLMAAGRLAEVDLPGPRSTVSSVGRFINSGQDEFNVTGGPTRSAIFFE